MANLAKYIVQLEAQTARYEQKLDQANRKLDRFERRNNKALASMKKAFIGLGTAAISYLGVRGVSGAIESIARSTIQLQRFERGLRAATGSSEGAAREMSFVREEADRLGLNLETAAEQYTKLTAAARGTALAGRESREIFIAISEAARVLGLSSEQTGGALTAIEQIISKGKVSAEELRGQLGERLPGAFQIAARSIGVTTAKLDEMLKKGELTAEQLLPAMARELRQTFGPEVENAANDAVASFERLRTAVFNLGVAIGESGLLDFLAKLADASAFVIDKAVYTELEKLEERIDQFRTAIRVGDDAGFELLGGQEQFDKDIARIQELKREVLGLRAPRVTLDSLDESNDGLNNFVVNARRAGEAVADLEKIVVKASPIEVRLNPDIDLASLDDLRQIKINPPTLLVKPTIDLDELTDKDFRAPEFRNIGESLGRAFQDGFEDMILGVEQSFGEFLKRLAVRAATSNLFNFLASFDNALGSAFSLLGFGGARAEGGPTAPGKSYLVGERGPEIWTPGATGYVSPMGQSVNVTQEFHFDVGLESVDSRIAQAAAPIARMTQTALMKSLGRPSMA